MAFDGIVTNSLINELNDKLIPGRIDKVYQPEEDEIYIHIRSQGENHVLLISANSSNPRFHLTNEKKKNPMEPPMFCMILRKYLIGASILRIEQLSMDRIIFIDISSTDELGIDSEKRIIVEIMGRHSNFILIDKETNKVIDSIKRVSEDMSRVRQVFPGSLYELPPLQDKANPLESNNEDFRKLIDKEDKELPVFKFFYFNYLGLSPLISKEFCYKAGISKNKKIKELDEKEINNLYQAFDLEMEKIKNNKFKPNLILNESEDKILAFHALAIDQFENSIVYEYDSISNLIDNYYLKKDTFDRVNQKSQSLRRIVQTNLDRSEKKLHKQGVEYGESLDREKYKIYADLLSANFHRVEAGAKEVVVENFYDEEMKDIKIPLNEKINGPANAQNYYKKYSRLKNASKLLKRKIPETKNEIEYLKNILLSIEHSQDTDDLEEIREELIKEGYIQSKKRKRRPNIESKPHHYISSDGLDIMVGKNNRQNDELTFKNSNRNDTWMHIQNMPGSHVIIKNNGQDLSDTSLEEAALLAAYYSSGRESNNVPIDYTERKNVKKPKGAKAGMVIYEDFQTIFVTPSRSKIDKIKKI